MICLPNSAGVQGASLWCPFFLFFECTAFGVAKRGCKARSFWESRRTPGQETFKQDLRREARTEAETGLPAIQFAESFSVGLSG